MTVLSVSDVEYPLAFVDDEHLKGEPDAAWIETEQPPEARPAVAHICQPTPKPSEP